MKFFSTLRIALHTLFQNKVRTALTLVIITVVSFVVVYLFSFLFSLNDSFNENINAMIHNDGVLLSVSVSYQETENSGYGNVDMPLEKVEEIIGLLDDDSGNFTYISMESRATLYYKGSGLDIRVQVRPYYAGSNPFIGQDDYLVSGRLWNESDFEAGSVFISKESAEAAGLAVGDKVTAFMGDAETEYTVRGIIDADSSRYHAYLDYRHFNGTPVYGSYDSSAMCVSNVSAVLTPQEGEMYGSAYQNYVSGLRDKIEKIRFNDSRLSISAHSQLLSIMMIVSILFWILFGFIMFLCVVIILLSINSVSNTVRISAEQNRKFFGMMKAIGMKNKTMRAILIMQVVIMLLIGVGLATGIAFLAAPGLEYFIGLIVGQIYFSLSAAPIAVSAVNPLVPLITFGLLTMFVMLFARTSLAEVSRMDVITVINEVS